MSLSKNGRIYVNINVLFDENIFPYYTFTSLVSSTSNFTCSYITMLLVLRSISSNINPTLSSFHYVSLLFQSISQHAPLSSYVSLSLSNNSLVPSRIFQHLPSVSNTLSSPMITSNQHSMVTWFKFETFKLKIVTASFTYLVYIEPTFIKQALVDTHSWNIMHWLKMALGPQSLQLRIKKIIGFKWVFRVKKLHTNQWLKALIRHMALTSLKDLIQYSNRPLFILYSLLTCIKNESYTNSISIIPF